MQLGALASFKLRIDRRGPVFLVATKPSIMSTQSDLGALLSIITEGITAIEGAYKANGHTFPSLDSTIVGPPPFDDRELHGPSSLVVAACAQVVAILTPPPVTLLAASGSVRSALSQSYFCSVFDG